MIYELHKLHIRSFYNSYFIHDKHYTNFTYVSYPKYLFTTLLGCKMLIYSTLDSIIFYIHFLPLSMGVPLFLLKSA